VHEMAIAEELMSQVLAAAAEHQAQCVERVEVSVGAMRLVVPESLQMAFRAVADGTIADGATLGITEEPIVAQCRVCGRRFDCDGEDFTCGDCGTADVDIVAGNDILLTSIVAETQSSV